MLIKKHVYQHLPTPAPDKPDKFDKPKKDKESGHAHENGETGESAGKQKRSGDDIAAGPPEKKSKKGGIQLIDPLPKQVRL